MRMPWRDDPADETLGQLFSRLADDGRNFATTQVAVYKQEALSRFAAMRMALVLFVVALLLVIGAVVTLLVGFALGLARWVGPAGGGAIVCVGALAVAALLAWIGAKSLSGGKS